MNQRKRLQQRTTPIERAASLRRRMSYGPLAFAVCVLALPQVAAAQTWGASGTTQLAVTVGPEASIRIDTASAALTTSGTTFSNPYTGSTSFTYKVRTTKAGGSGAITVYVSSDFPGAGPKAASGDLSYGCSLTGVGTGCSTSVAAASQSAATAVAMFGANAHSTVTGDSGTVAWSLANKPTYETGDYQATVTFTISAL